MTDLLAAELLRLRSRIAVWALLGVALLAVVAFMVGQAVTHVDDYDQASRQFAIDRADGYETARTAYLLTLKSVGAAQLSTDARDISVQEYVAGHEFFGGVTEVPSRRFSLRDQMPEITKSVSVIFVLAGFMIGATYAGADWGARAIHVLLAWDSRRGRVLLAKLIVVGLAVAASTMAGHLLAQVMGGATGIFRGTNAGVDGAWWLSELSAAGRGALLAAMASALGFVLAFGARSTGFALGLGFLYLSMAESLLLAWRPRLEPHLLRGAANAFLDGGNTIMIYSTGREPVQLAVAMGSASGTLALFLVVPVLACLFSFTRRDVL